MAEWSKALVSGSIHVENILVFTGVGSNPTLFKTVLLRLAGFTTLSSAEIVFLARKPLSDGQR